MNRKLSWSTGFDRVMAYRFDDEWNGRVVAEAKADQLPTFLGQQYPASDIPSQARRLYTAHGKPARAHRRAWRGSVVRG